MDKTGVSDGENISIHLGSTNNRYLMNQITINNYMWITLKKVWNVTLVLYLGIK